MSSSFLRNQNIQSPQSPNNNLTPAVKVFSHNTPELLEHNINLWILTLVADPQFHYFINEIQYQNNQNNHSALAHFTIYERE